MLLINIWVLTTNGLLLSSVYGSRPLGIKVPPVGIIIECGISHSYLMIQCVYELGMLRSLIATRWFQHVHVLQHVVSHALKTLQNCLLVMNSA